MKLNIVEVCAAAVELVWPVDWNDVAYAISIYLCVVWKIEYAWDWSLNPGLLDVNKVNNLVG